MVARPRGRTARARDLALYGWPGGWRASRGWAPWPRCSSDVPVAHRGRGLAGADRPRARRALSSRRAALAPGSTRQRARSPAGVARARCLAEPSLAVGLVWSWCRRARRPRPQARPLADRLDLVLLTAAIAWASVRARLDPVPDAPGLGARSPRTLPLGLLALAGKRAWPGALQRCSTRLTAASSAWLVASWIGLLLALGALWSAHARWPRVVPAIPPLRRARGAATALPTTVSSPSRTATLRRRGLELALAFALQSLLARATGAAVALGAVLALACAAGTWLRLPAWRSGARAAGGGAGRERRAARARFPGPMALPARAAERRAARARCARSPRASRRRARPAPPRRDRAAPRADPGPGAALRARGGGARGVPRGVPRLGARGGAVGRGLPARRASMARAAHLEAAAEEAPTGARRSCASAWCEADARRPARGRRSRAPSSSIRRSADAWCGLGLAQFQQEETLTRAVASLTRAARLEPDHAESRATLGAHPGGPRRARRGGAKPAAALGANPDSVDALYALGTLLSARAHGRALRLPRPAVRHAAADAARARPPRARGCTWRAARSSCRAGAAARGAGLQPRAGRGARAACAPAPEGDGPMSAGKAGARTTLAVCAALVLAVLTTYAGVGSFDVRALRRPGLRARESGRCAAGSPGAASAGPSPRPTPPTGTR